MGKKIQEGDAPKGMDDYRERERARRAQRSKGAKGSKLTASAPRQKNKSPWRTRHRKRRCERTLKCRRSRCRGCRFEREVGKRRFERMALRRTRRSMCSEAIESISRWAPRIWRRNGPRTLNRCCKTRNERRRDKNDVLVGHI